MLLEGLSLNEWNQFNRIEIDFHRKVTIITGANGAGKSTVLRLIANQLGWNYEVVSKIIKNENKSMFLAGLDIEDVNKRFSNKEIEKLRKYLNKLQETSETWIDKIEVESISMGELKFEKGTLKLYVPEQIDSGSYNVESRFKFFDSDKLHQLYEIEDLIQGVNISSHRLPYSYSKVKNIPLSMNNTYNLYEEYLEALKDRVLNRDYFEKESPVQYMKKSLISLALFGEGNSFVEGNEDLKDKFLGFTNILKSVLPKHLGFQKISIESEEVVLKTKTGDFLIDAVSGGLGSLIDLAWQIYMYKDSNEEFTILIDEIENHLHPSMQREILPSLIEAFPKAQFIISTHSPFVVNSVKEANVYALHYNQDNKVESIKLDFENKNKDAFDILKTVLGVSVTMPIWLEKELEEVLENFNLKQLDSLSYYNLKKYLANKGLEEFLPEVVSKFGV